MSAALLRLLSVAGLCLLAGSANGNPRADYLLHCGGCHLPDGTGSPPDVPSLINTLGRIVASEEGRDYVVRVPGASQTPLSDEQLAEVMNWVLRTFNSETLDKKFKPLNGKQVGQARQRVLADPVKLRERLWPDYD
jgi:cytochrome c553